MDILTVLKTIIRRWWVVLPILLATASMAYSVGSSIKPEFGMAGTVLLAPESGSAIATADTSPVVTAAVLAETLRSAAAVKRMADLGATSPYVVDVDNTTSILRVTAAGREGPVNVKTIEVILENLDKELGIVERAADVPEGRKALVKLLSTPAGQPGAGIPSASGSAFLISAGGGQANPYTPNAYTTRVVTELMLAADTRQRVFDRAGGATKFLLTATQRDAAPILSISVRGLDPVLVESTYDAIVKTVGELLDEGQTKAGVEAKSRTGVIPLNTPAGALKTSGTVVKSVATIVGLGLIVAATMAILTESLLAGRSARRKPVSRVANGTEGIAGPATAESPDVGVGTRILDAPGDLLAAPQESRGKRQRRERQRRGSAPKEAPYSEVAKVERSATASPPEIGESPEGPAGVEAAAEPAGQPPVVRRQAASERSKRPEVSANGNGVEAAAIGSRMNGSSAASDESAIGGERPKRAQRRRVKADIISDSSDSTADPTYGTPEDG